jgi:SAM-dependent methyltransferase
MAPSAAFEAWDGWGAWQATRTAEDERFNDAYRTRLAAVQAARDAGFEARCSACGRRGRFHVARSASGEAEAHRERLACPACRLPGRTRAALAVLDDEGLGPEAALYATEHGSPLIAQLRRRVHHVATSEFHPRRRPLLGRLRHWIRHGAATHQDLRSLSFPDAAWDAVLCLDVFEHIDAVDAAFAECARVLRPGGVLVATAPFDENAETDRRLATLREGDVLEWSGAEEWHADPLGGRVPCFHRFGWAVLPRLRAAGFREAQLCRVDAPDEALFGLWVIRARR